MGQCRYCGEDAGFLRGRHRECQRRIEQGWSQMVAMSQRAAAYGQRDIDYLEPMLQNVAASSYIHPQSARRALIQGWTSAVDGFLDDHLITEPEERRLQSYARRFGLSRAELDDNGAYTRLTQAAVIRDLQNGVRPPASKFPGIIPFNLLKSESLCWLFDDVNYHEEKVRVEREGNFNSLSFRVIKGVYYTTGQSRSRPVERRFTEHVDNGLLGLTDKHIYFSGSHKKFRLRYDKIVTFDPTPDGIVVMRDALSAKSQIFQTGDGWFVYNLVTTLARA